MYLLIPPCLSTCMKHPTGGFRFWGILLILICTPLTLRFPFQWQEGVWKVTQIILNLTDTYILTPRRWALLEKLTCLQLVKKFPAFYGTRRFITAFTSVQHLYLSSARSIESIPPTSWKSILYYLPIYTWVFYVASVLHVSPPKPYTRLSSPHTRYIPLPSYSQFYHPNNIRRGI
jgi:hypothetical protein